MPAMRSGTHRDDIDGLRCLAVLPVVLFHLQVRHFSGGYVGVDIFFVISGYLITGIVAKETQDNRFSFTRFYERRVRRIVPALLAVLLCTSVGAIVLLGPVDLQSYGHSMIATIFSFSNFYFWTQASYFSPTFFKLLLHTWSLSVEEQFYLILPLAVFLLRHKWHLLRYILIATCVASFVLCCWMSSVMPTAAFYAPWSRAWELLIGSLLALFPSRRVYTIFTYNIIGLAGLLLILLAVVELGQAARFPGPTALLPCSGAALILFSGEHGTVVARLLSWRPIVFIGLISYSVYLVHWPLLLLLPMVALPGDEATSALGQVLILFLSLGLGALSWRYIEAPFRARQRMSWTSRRIWYGYLFAACLTMAIASAFVFEKGFPARFTAEGNHILNKDASQQSGRNGQCFITTANRFDRDFDPHICADQIPGRENYLVLGDSHAAAMWHAFVDQMPGVAFQQINSSGCRMLPRAYDASNCGMAKRFVFQTYLPATRPDLTILVERWTDPSDARQIAVVASWFRAHQLPLIIVGPTLEYSEPLAYLIAMSERWGDHHLPERFQRTSFRRLDNALRAESERQHVPYLSLIAAICTQDGPCAMYVKGNRDQPVMFDNSHLTPQAASVAVQDWLQHGKLHMLPMSALAKGQHR